MTSRWAENKLQFCEHWVFGKKIELDYLQAFISQRGHLTIYIQTFGGGPAKVSSMGGTTYMLTIIDDFSHKV